MAEKKTTRIAMYGEGNSSVILPEAAVIKVYALSTVLSMPRGGKFEGYRFMVSNKDFNQMGDGTVEVTFGKESEGGVNLRRRGEEKKVDLDTFLGALDFAEDGQFVPEMYEIRIPSGALYGNYPNYARAKFPDRSKYKGQFIVIPRSYENPSESTESEKVFSIPDYMNFFVRNSKGEDDLVPVAELSKELTYGEKARALPKKAVPAKGNISER